MGLAFAHFEGSPIAILFIALIVGATALFAAERPAMISADLWIFLTDPVSRSTVDKRALYLEFSAWLAGGVFFFAALDAYWKPRTIAFWCFGSMVCFPIRINVSRPHLLAKSVELINLLVMVPLFYFAVAALQQSTNADVLIFGVYTLIGAALLALSGPTFHFSKFSLGEAT